MPASEAAPDRFQTTTSANTPAWPPGNKIGLKGSGQIASVPAPEVRGKWGRRTNKRLLKEAKLNGNVLTPALLNKFMAEGFTQRQILNRASRLGLKERNRQSSRNTSRRGAQSDGDKNGTAEAIGNGNDATNLDSDHAALMHDAGLGEHDVNVIGEEEDEMYDEEEIPDDEDDDDDDDDEDFKVKSKSSRHSQSRANQQSNTTLASNGDVGLLSPSSSIDDNAHPLAQDGINISEPQTIASLTSAGYGRVDGY